MIVWLRNEQQYVHVFNMAELNNFNRHILFIAYNWWTISGKRLSSLIILKEFSLDAVNS